MSKKNSKLTPGQYWEWRETLSEMEIGKLKLELHRKHISSLQKDATIIHLRLEKAKNDDSRMVKRCKDLDAEYHKFTEELEKDLGCSFKGKIIDPVTLEILTDEQVKLGDFK